jgi:TolB-like protein/Tfp pilus assembly protein PilF
MKLSEPGDNLRFEIGHVLFIDIVGYSKLLIEDQKERLDQLTEVVLQTQQVGQMTDEQLVRLPTGDGMALVFRHSAEEPARCALEIAGALKKHPEIPVRMGIHSGPVSEVTDVSGRGNLAGAGINIAQRVMDCGDAGHILLSQHVADDLAQYRQWAPLLHDLGECEVKHGLRLHLVNLYGEEVGNPALPTKLEQSAKAPSAEAAASPARRNKPSPIVLTALAFALICLAIVALIFAPAVMKSFSRGHKAVGSASTPAAIAAAIPEKSIAVMPFENLSSDKENAYFADGIQDEILTRLSKIADLRVISRTSTEHYKSAPENLPEIAKQLGVANILEGSVQKSGEAVRVNVQLIKAANDSHLWADTFDRKLTDVFAVESEVAKAIADKLHAKLSGDEEAVVSAKPTNNPAAYDAYLRGLAYTLKTTPTPANGLGAQKYLREAVRLDPKFAQAWALLSYTDSQGYLTQSLQPTNALRDEARQAAETALTLQPDLGEAVLAKGYYFYSCLKDYDTAVRYFEQARPLMPNSSQIPEVLAYVARRQGRWDQSQAYLEEAERLDPRNVYLLTQQTLSCIALRRFPEALRKLNQVLDITPDDPDTLAYKATIAQAEGDLPRAATLLAPLHPNAAELYALETKIYQAILERHTAPVIPWLTEVLTRPEPGLGFDNGELRFYLGWAQEVAGDHLAAWQSWLQARSELEPFLEEEPNNHLLLGDLALANMALGDKSAALSFAERAVAANPLEKDAVTGVRGLEVFARVDAQSGQPDRALPLIEKLLSTPGSGIMERTLPITPALLRLDPMWDPLRNDPRFQKLASATTGR